MILSLVTSVFKIYISINKGAIKDIHLDIAPSILMEKMDVSKAQIEYKTKTPKKELCFILLNAGLIMKETIRSITDNFGKEK